MTKTRQNPFGSPPFFAIFQAPPCKVIRIGKRVQPATSKARQQVNIDRPAYTKTDKQCRTRTTITARLPDDQVPPLKISIRRTIGT